MDPCLFSSNHDSLSSRELSPLYVQREHHDESYLYIAIARRIRDIGHDEDAADELKAIMVQSLGAKSPLSIPLIVHSSSSSSLLTLDFAEFGQLLLEQLKIKCIVSAGIDNFNCKYVRGDGVEIR